MVVQWWVWWGWWVGGGGGGGGARPQTRARAGFITRPFGGVCCVNVVFCFVLIASSARSRLVPARVPARCLISTWLRPMLWSSFKLEFTAARPILRSGFVVVAVLFIGCFGLKLCRNAIPSFLC